MRLISMLSVALLLTGCINVDSLVPEKRTPADTSYYLLDTKFRFICLGNTKRCADMTKVVSSRAQLRPIESAYGTKVKGPNYPVSLMRMIMNPADQSYKSVPVGDDGRFFKVPINDKTQVAWDTLSNIESNLFNAGS